MGVNIIVQFAANFPWPFARVRWILHCGRPESLYVL